LLGKVAGVAVGWLVLLGATAVGQPEPSLARIVSTEAGDIWTIDAHGDNRRRVLSNAGSPDWSPDGTHIVASTNKGVAIVAAGGGDLRYLARSVGDERITGPKWSPDGTRIAFSSTSGEPGRDLVSALEVVGTDGSGRHAVLERPPTRAPQFVTVSAWTPDGTRLLYTSSRLTTASVRSVGLSGEDDRRILQDALGAVPSPDGKSLAFLTLRGTGNEVPCEFCLPAGDLAVASSSGTGRRTVLITAAEEGVPTWSADGDRLAFTSGRNVPEGIEFPDHELYTIGIDGSCLTWLTNDTDSASEPDWSPTGRTAPRTCGASRRKPELASPPGRRFRRAPWLGRAFGDALLTSAQGGGGGSLFAYVDCGVFEPRSCPPLFLVVSQSACRPSRDVLFQTRRADDFRRVRRAVVARAQDGRGIVYIGRWFVFIQTESGSERNRDLVRRVAARLRTVSGARFGSTRVHAKVRRAFPARLRGRTGRC